MKKILICFIFMLFYVSGVMAAPFLICAPAAGITKYRYVTPAGAEVVDAEADGTVKHNLANAPAGTTNGELSAGMPWMLDGIPTEVIDWSTPTPFVLGRPSNVRSPTGIGISE